VIDDRDLDRIVSAVLTRMRTGDDARAEPPSAPLGVHKTADQAVAAAFDAHKAVVGLSLETRRNIVGNIRKAALDAVDRLSRSAVDETGMGRVDDKIAKNLLAASRTPGVEHLEPIAYTGDNGLTLVERAPHGVILSVTPCTNPTETLLNNGIGMIAGGNGVVFNPHPLARDTSIACIDLMNRASAAAGGPDSLFNAVAEPSIETAQALMTHAGVRLVVVTGGGGVVQAAMTSGKKCIAAGPGNPPVVVDASADLQQAGIGIVRGASFDNNVICTDEKEVFAVDGVCDALLAVMCANGAVKLAPKDVDKLQRFIFPNGKFDRSLVGKSASHFLKAIDVPFTGDPRIVTCEVANDHDFVQYEMLLPVIPVVRCKSVDEAMARALAAEHGYRHTASMYSKNLDNLHTMARAFDGSIFVKNAPNYAGLGFGGEGYTSWTIASPTGEGLTTCRDFTRVRRCTLAGHFRIV
jgi:acyl-CoA reductase-like NAD-dependent aldehyde dehydrogenase